MKKSLNQTFIFPKNFKSKLKFENNWETVYVYFIKVSEVIHKKKIMFLFSKKDFFLIFILIQSISFFFCTTNRKISSCFWRTRTPYCVYSYNLWSNARHIFFQKPNNTKKIEKKPINTQTWKTSYVQNKTSKKVTNGMWSLIPAVSGHNEYIQYGHTDTHQEACCSRRNICMNGIVVAIIIKVVKAVVYNMHLLSVHTVTRKRR